MKIQNDNYALKCQQIVIDPNVMPVIPDAEFNNRPVNVTHTCCQVKKQNTLINDHILQVVNIKCNVNKM